MHITDLHHVVIIGIFFSVGLLAISWVNQSYFYEAYSQEGDKKNENITSLIKKGDEFYDLDRYDEAIKYYDMALALDENDTHALSHKGDVLYYLDRYDEAIKYYDMALAINKTDTYSISGKGDVSYSLGRYDEAIKYYDKALAIDKNDTYALASKGDTLNSLRRYNEAIDNYDKALAIDKNDTYALASKGNSLYTLGLYDQAIDNYDKALAIDKNDTYALDGKAVTLYVLDRYGEAIKYYDMALAIDKNDTYALLGKGDSFYALEYYKDAIQQYNAVLDIEPDNIQANQSKQEILKKIIEERNSSNLEDSGYIQLSQDEWLTDPLSIYIKIDSSLKYPTAYLNIALDAIDKWSQLLKQKSGNYVAWNFSILNSIDNPKIEEISKPIDAVLYITRSSLGDDCRQYAGYTYQFPLARNEPVYSKVFASCEESFVEKFLSGQQVHSIILHEFGHILGLDHTFEKQGDLMCPNVYEEPAEEYNGCMMSNGKNVPSELDIDALMYKYGLDGFRSPNTKVKDHSWFDFSFQRPVIFN